MADPVHGVIIEHQSFTAWCWICDSSVSPARRDTRNAAVDDLTVHIRIQHAEVSRG